MGRSIFGFPDTLSEYALKDYLRIVMIICTYLIIRPYLVRVGEKIQKKQYEKEGAAKEKAEGEEEEPDFDQIAAESSKEWGWGSGAKDRATKQRKVAAEELRRKEKIAQSMDDDEDVSDLLN